MKKSFLASYWSLLILSLLETCFQLWQMWTDPMDILSDSSACIAALGWLPLILLAGAELVRYGRWQRRAKAAADLGQPLPDLRSARLLSVLVLAWSGILALLMFLGAFQKSRGMLLLTAGIFLYMGLMILLSNAARDAMKHLKVPRWVNIAVTLGMVITLTAGGMAGMVALILRNSGSGWLEDHPPVETYEYKGMTWQVYQDDIPLRIEDLADTDYDQWSTKAQVDRSPLLTHGTYTQRPRMDALDQPDLEYELVIVKAGFLYNLCKNDFISWVERDNDRLPEEFRDEYRPVDAAPWSAAEVYQRYCSGEPVNQFLICWPDRIAEVKFDWDWTITEEMRSAVSQALQPPQ